MEYDLTLTSLFIDDPDIFRVLAGKTVFKVGEPGNEMYVLMSGKAEIIVKGHVVEQAGPGAIIGELALIDSSPRAATCIALTDCKLVAIGRRRFHTLIQRTPLFATQVMRTMAQRLRNADAFIAAHTGGSDQTEAATADA